MYITKIDELIDKIIDNFYNVVVIKNKDFIKITKEINFVKYQELLNKILIGYEKYIDIKEIQKIIRNSDNVNIIINILKKYIGYYVFLYIGFLYKEKRDTYINNVIDFSKNQYNFDYRVTNFFNSESNGNIIRLFILIKNITALVNADKVKLNILVKKHEYQDAIDILNEIGGVGGEYVNKNFKLINVGGSVREQGHNIVKFIIISELYIKEEKKNVYTILEETEKEEGEYIYIDIVIPRATYIDFSAIESVLDKKDIDSGLVREIYDLIRSEEDVDRIDVMSHDDKILELVNNKVVIPISEDFLLYHKDTERYDKYMTLVPGRKPKREETKIRYIVGKIDNASELHSAATKKNEEAKKKIEKLFYLPMKHRKVVLINDTEEIKIINKIHNLGRKSMENNEYYNDLINYRLYSYTNFKDLKNYGFPLTTNKMIDVIRSVSIVDDENKTHFIEWRVGSKKQTVSVIGLIIPTNIVPFQCLKIKDIYNIRQLKFNNEKKLYQNGYNGTIKFLEHILFKKRKYKTSIYWLFDLKKDSIRIEQYEQLTKMTNEQQTRIIVSSLYDEIANIIYKKILDTIDKRKYISLYEFEKILTNVESKVFRIPRNSDIYYQLKNIVYSEKYTKAVSRYDKKDDFFPGLYGDIIRLPIAPKEKKKKITVISLLEIKEKKEKEILTDIEIYDAICQHHITWENMSALRKKDPNKFQEQLFEFISQYVIENDEREYVCKSCSFRIDIKKYIKDGKYDDSGHFIAFNIPMTVPLEEIREYSKYDLTISMLGKNIEKIGNICNIPYLVGSFKSYKWRRMRIVKDKKSC